MRLALMHFALMHLGRRRGCRLCRRRVWHAAVMPRNLRQTRMIVPQKGMNLYHAPGGPSPMTRRLPPFGPLIAFDAVARHRSFTRAADELGVTQSAVSHQVRRLEDFLGVQLLKRLNPGVELSDDGAKFQGELATHLDGIAGLEPSLRRRPGRQTLRVGAGSSLAAWWLVRRLRAFRALHSEIEIDFVPVESEAVGAPSLDVRILWTTLAESRATSLQASLFRERVFPVCAPSILPRGRPLSDLAALLDLPLIQKAHTPSC